MALTSHRNFVIFFVAIILREISIFIVRNLLYFATIYIFTDRIFIRITVCKSQFWSQNNHKLKRINQSPFRCIFIVEKNF